MSHSDRSEAETTNTAHLAPSAAVIDCRQRQKPSDLPTVFVRLRDASRTVYIEVLAQTDCRSHRKPPARDAEADQTDFESP